MNASLNITAAATALLDEARDAASGRAGRTLQGQAHAGLKQTLLAHSDTVVLLTIAGSDAPA